MRNPKNILITGASSGIGFALALEYAAPSVLLAITGRDQERLLQNAARLKTKGAQVETALIDVTDQEAMAKWMTRIDTLYPLDLVIANAGISGGSLGHEYGEPVAQARKILEVNLTGVLNTIEPALEPMKARGCGQIAIMSSLAGFRGWPGAPGYSASKCAVRAYGEALRGSVRPSGVQINVICPGFVVSRMTDANSFPMPFMMKTEKAAKIIVKGLAKDRGRIAFPLPTHFFAWLLATLPDFLSQKLLSPLPKKG